jgi:hypothetical protein
MVSALPLNRNVAVSFGAAEARSLLAAPDGSKGRDLPTVVMSAVRQSPVSATAHPGRLRHNLAF